MSKLKSVLFEIRIIFRCFGCFIFGHVSKCYQSPAGSDAEKLFHDMRRDLNLPPSKWWRKNGMGWCAYCGQHTKEPVRLRNSK